MARLERVHQGRQNLPAVVFIHGLDGDIFGTWVGPGTSSDDCWPHWVGQDTDHDIWVLGYDAALSKWHDQAMPLPDQADQIANLLAVRTELANKELILIGHSMGGLVIKTMITQGRAKDDQRVLRLIERIRGVVFVATPHQGSELALLAQALKGLVRPNQQVENLRLHDPHLRQLNTSFRAAHAALRFAVQAFAETRNVEWRAKRWFLPWLTRLICVRVVDPSSSDPGLPGVNAVPLAQDHISISKPASRDEQIHQAVCMFLREDVPRACTPAAPKPSPGFAPAPTPPPARLTGAADKRLQPVDNRFYGREATVAEVLAFLCSDGDSAIVVPAREVSGTGGIGKTEVCKAALKSWLTKQPDACVWYLSLPDGASLADLLALAQRGLSLPQDIDSPAKLLQALPPGLYYLDNLESVADLPEGRKLLAEWAGLRDVRLLVSSRLSFPAVFGQTVAVDRLPDEAALRLFRDTWSGPADQLPALDTDLGRFVVAELGAHPLSIVLCARLGDWCSYAELQRRWYEQGTATAKDSQHPNQRLGSLDTSLDLTAHALQQRYPQALLLWAASAVFHGGVSDETLAELEQESGWIDARQWLVRHHVLARNPEGRWAMLPPLARYALDAAQMGRAQFDWFSARSPLLVIFSKRVATVQSTRSDDQVLTARRWLQQHFDALARLMLREMEAIQADDGWLRAISSGLGNEYQFNAVLAAPLMQRLQSRYADNPALLLRQGILERRLGEVGKARELYEQALALFKKESAGLGQANTLQALGDLERRLGEVGKARELYEQALALFKKESDGLGQANTLKALGDLESRLGEVGKARELYEQALALFKKESAGLGQANTLKALGDLERRLGEVGKARELYEQALALFKKESDGLGQANTLKALGDLESRLGEVGKARELYEQALALFKKESAGLGQANTLKALGDLESRLGEVGKARELYEQALALFKKESASLGQANTLKALGDLERRLGEVGKARELYEQALALFKKESAGLGQANTLKALGDLESRLGEVGKARELYEQALALFKKESAGLGQANTLQALGDLERESDSWEPALAIYMEALGFYQKEQEQMGLSYTLVELARCLHALQREQERDRALLAALAAAQRSNTPHVMNYVGHVLVEITGGPEQAQAWWVARADM